MIGIICLIVSLIITIINGVIINDLETRFTYAISIIEILKTKKKINEESAEEILSQLQWHKIIK